MVVPARPSRGFSLAEVMTVLVVTSVAGAIALPQLSEQIRRAREPAEVAVLQAFLAESRNLARRLNRCVTVTVAGRLLTRTLVDNVHPACAPEALEDFDPQAFCPCQQSALASDLPPTKQLASVVTATAMTTGLAYPAALSTLQAKNGVIFLPSGGTPYTTNVDVQLTFASGRRNGVLVMAGSGISRQADAPTTTMPAKAEPVGELPLPQQRRPPRRPCRRRRLVFAGRPGRGHRRRLLRARGFSLLEVMVASVLFLSSLSGLLAGMQTLQNVEDHQRRLTTAARLGQTEMERALLLPACAPAAPPPADGEPERVDDGKLAALRTDDVCLDARTFIYAANGLLRAGKTAPEQPADLTARRALVELTQGATASERLVRVDVQVAWTDAGGAQTLDFSTYRYFELE